MAAVRVQPGPVLGGEAPVLQALVDAVQSVEGRSTIDVGSGDGKYTNRLLGWLPDLTTWALDAYAPGLASTTASIKIIGALPGALAAVRDKAVDVAFCLDVIEHLEKTPSIDLVRQLERVARKAVVLFTPRGYMPQDGLDAGERGWQPWLAHRCGWEVEELEEMGYEVVVWDRFDYGKGLHDAIWAVKRLG